jgi:hypothetical protein
MMKLRKRADSDAKAIYKDDLSSGEEDENKNDDDAYVSAAEDKVEDDDQDDDKGDEGEVEDNDEDNEDNNESDESDESEVEEIYKKPSQYVRKVEGRKYRIGFDENTVEGRKIAPNQRARDERIIRTLTYFGGEFDSEEFFKHGEHFRQQTKFLREKPRGSNISRKQMYEAEKRRNCVSSQAREVTRTRGRKKIDKEEPIVVDDLSPAVVNNSIDELAAETSTKKKRKKRRKRRKITTRGVYSY